MHHARREFLKRVAHSGGALVLSTALPLSGLLTRRAAAAEVTAAPAAKVDPLAFIRINSDNTIELVSKHLEMGQGVVTGMATVIADELGADWSQMRYRFAPADARRYANLKLGLQGTGGSTSMSESFPQMRLTAAACRQMLATAAGQAWHCPAGEVVASHGHLHHPPTGRKLAFGKVAAAAARLPIPQQIELKPTSEFKLIGTRPGPRLDGAEKTTGRALYGLDVRRPGMVRAVIARPPRFGGRLKSHDASAARKVPGVLDVVVVPAGVAVVAQDSWSAMRGRDALVIEWDDSAAELRSSGDIMAGYRQTAAGEGLDVVSRGNARARIAAAATILEADYAVPLLAHAPMEPLGVVVELGDRGVELWGGFQIPTLDQAAAATALDLKPEQVTLHNVLAGGSFGRRTDAEYIKEACTVARAWNGGRPLHMFYTRTDDLQAGYYRPHFLHRLRAGLDKEGRLTAWQQQVIGPSIVAGTPMEGMMKDGIDSTSVDGARNNFYDIPETHVTLVTPPNKIKLLAWRSVGNTHSGFAMECFVDELAAAAGVDAVEFRLRHLDNRPDMQRLLRLVAEKAKWGMPMAKGQGRGLAIREAFGTRVAQVAEVTANPDGSFKVDRVVCAVDCGIAVNPDMIAAQIEGGIGWGLGAMLQNEITLVDGLVQQTNFDGYRPLRIHQMPVIEVHIMPSAAAPTGVGELGVPCVAPAVANAIFNATGRRIRALPLEA